MILSDSETSATAKDDQGEGGKGKIKIKRLTSLMAQESIVKILGGPEKDRVKAWSSAAVSQSKPDILSTLTTDTPGQLDVFGHDGDTLGMDGAQVGVFEQTDQVSFAGLLQSHDSRALESEVSFEVLSDFSHQTLEWQFADEELSALLVTTDLTEGDCAGPVSVRFLHATGGRGGFPGSLGGQLFARSFASSGFTGGLLSTGHVDTSKCSVLCDSPNDAAPLI